MFDTIWSFYKLNANLSYELPPTFIESLFPSRKKLNVDIFEFHSKLLSEKFPIGKNRKNHFGWWIFFSNYTSAFWRFSSEYTQHTIIKGLSRIEYEQQLNDILTIHHRDREKAAKDYLNSIWGRKQ